MLTVSCVMFFFGVPCYFVTWIFDLGGYEKTWHMTQLTFSSNFYWKICFKFCILEQIIATVLFICISSINNKRSLLRFQSITAPTNRGWSACGGANLFFFSQSLSEGPWELGGLEKREKALGTTYPLCTFLYNLAQFEIVVFLTSNKELFLF